MRILKVTQAYYPFQDRGGPAFKVRSIARVLAAQGHKVTVLTADLGFGTSQIASVGATRSPQGWRSNSDNVEVSYLATRGHYRSLTVNPGVLPFCRHHLSEFDVVHIYGLYDLLGPIVARYCRKLRIPYFVEPLGMTRAIDRGFLLKRVWNTLVPGYLAQASKVIATSGLEMEELLTDGFPAQNILLRYNGLDLEEFRSIPARGTFRQKMNIQDQDRLVVFLGRIIPRKGADLLIEALTHNGCNKMKLVIAGPEGETGYVNLLREKARALGVERQVFFPGPLYGDDKKSALADADVFALPSRYENFGNTAAEAIACGTPAMVSDRCGISSLINGRAGLVTAYDSEAVAKGLGTLFQDTDQYHQLKAGCSKVASELSWIKLVCGLQDSYENARNNFLRYSPV
jgi:glycosyltransferase involved in cell wall biosynthesis